MSLKPQVGPTIAYPDYIPEAPQQNGLEGSSAQEEQPAAATEFYSDIAQALFSEHKRKLVIDSISTLE